MTMTIGVVAMAFIGKPVGIRAIGVILGEVAKPLILAILV